MLPSIMTSRARQVLEEALQLTPEERAAIADELYESLPAEDAEAAWIAEAQRRYADLRAGKGRGPLAREAIAELRARLRRSA
jgi:putative addiction module component (TIGR02574 family)